MKKYLKNTVVINKNKLIQNYMKYDISNEIKLKLFNTGVDSFMEFAKNNNIKLNFINKKINVSR